MCLIVVVYAPQDQIKKKKLLYDVSRLIANYNTLFIVLGDFNEVRNESKRMGTIFDRGGASLFNDFISSSGLRDLPMGAKRCTRMNNLGNKLSKIDRILVSSHVVDKWPNSHTIALTREFSDHSHILLLNSVADYGPIPFKLFNSWLGHTDFTPIVQSCWASSTFGHIHPVVSFKLKLQQLKASIKRWHITVHKAEHLVSIDLQNKIDFLDSKAEITPLTTTKIDSRTAYVKSLADMEYRNKKRLMLFKVDFEKAFDSLSWNFLLSIMEQIGFSSKWRNWILSCLNSSFALVLINGSPTMEFKLERGLRQGDPLSPFLFIIAVEALNIVILKAINRNIFYGFKVGKDKVYISHLQFADDALFLGGWSLSNAKNFSRILTCFHLAFGLKVNFNKSKLFGIGVSSLEVNSFASSIGCLASHLPRSYLGLPIGAKMSRCTNWKPLVERFQKRLSKWKANTFSFGGHLTLIRSVLGSLGVYYFSIFKATKKVFSKLESIRRKFFWGDFSDVKKISWIAWEKVLSPRNKGGIGIGRLSTSNHSLLAKWWWRFRTEEHALWCKVIRSIHGVSGGLIEDSNTSTSSGLWLRIMKLKTDLNLIGIDLPMLFKKKVGNGQNTRFWHDNWLGGVSLHAFFPRLYRLESNPNCLVCERNTIASPHQLVGHVTGHGHITGPGRVTSSVIHTTMGQTYFPKSFQPTPVGLSFNWACIRRPYTVGEREELIILTNLLANLHLNAKEYIWEFTYGASRLFTTQCMPNLITLNSYFSNLQPTRWNNILPAKNPKSTSLYIAKLLATLGKQYFRGG
ncbi:putative RNA-directed DNA polymerase, eukaryota, reverse transcriptase zinc-binding domain protein, partial [Tanacetum coccineum]